MEDRGVAEGEGQGEAGVARVPVVDLSCADERALEAQIGAALREFGFFYVTRYWGAEQDGARGGGAAAGGEEGQDAVLEELVRASRAFFARPREEKMSIHMRHSGAQWRGYFPVGEELTKGAPDMKEGLYLGTDEPEEDRGVKSERDLPPMHGWNVFLPDDPLAQLVPQHMARMQRLGHRLMRLIAGSLGLPQDFFQPFFGRPAGADHNDTSEDANRDEAQSEQGERQQQPTCLLRLFNYPPLPVMAQEFASFLVENPDRQLFSVGRHTDYGILTLLWQDSTGGLQILPRSRQRQGPGGDSGEEDETEEDWIDAPPIPNSLIVNIGDALEIWTRGRYQATPHRVRNKSATQDRLSIPFFFDPSFDCTIQPLPVDLVGNEAGEAEYRHASGVRLPIVYGNYLLLKVSRVFPDLADATSVLQDQEQKQVAAKVLAAEVRQPPRTEGDRDGDASGHRDIANMEEWPLGSGAESEEEVRERWAHEQEDIAARVRLEDDTPGGLRFRGSDAETKAEETTSGTAVRYVGGVDLSFVKDCAVDAVASLVVCEVPTMNVVEEVHRRVELHEPYISGFLAFREVPHLLGLFDELRERAPHLYPDIVMVDGNGLLHHRACGVACHLGVLLDVPTIGVAKNLLYVDGLTRESVKELLAGKPEVEGDEVLEMLVGDSGRTWGAAFCPRGVRNPVYISSGHRVSLETAVSLVRASSHHRIPEPVRQADLRGREQVRQWVAERG